MKRLTLGIPLLMASLILGVILGAAQAAAPRAIITVNSTADSLIPADTNCTLREAINNANSNGDSTGGDCLAGTGVDTIILPAGVYTLTILGAGEDSNASGDLDIFDDLTINGAGAGTTIINGNQLDRVVHIFGSNSVTLTGLTISGGEVTGSDGGGIFNQDGNLIVNDSVVQSNVTQDNGNGGGIANRNGQAVLNNTIVQNNQVMTITSFAGGGLANFADTSSASITLVDSQIIGNRAPLGGGINNLAGNGVTATLTVLSSTIANNLADGTDDGYGGGIYSNFVDGAATPHTIVTISDSAILNNTANSDNVSIGGGMYLFNIHPDLQQVTIQRTIIGGNQSIGPAFSEVAGAAFENAVVLIDQTLVVSNTTAGYVGGLLYWNSSGTVVNSTITGNNSSLLAGGLGVGTNNSPAPVLVDVVNTTIAYNDGGTGSGLWLGIYNGAYAPTVNLVNTIIAHNVDPQNRNCFNGALGPGVLESLGHNLEDRDSCDFDQPSDQVNTDPLLGPLQDNGGPTWTHSLLDFSPAIDAGDDAVCAAPPVNNVDQRGVLRPIGPHCDIGPYESTAMPPTTTYTIYLPVILKP